MTAYPDPLYKVQVSEELVKHLFRTETEGATTAISEPVAVAGAQDGLAPLAQSANELNVLQQPSPARIAFLQRDGKRPMPVEGALLLEISASYACEENADLRADQTIRLFQCTDGAIAVSIQIVPSADFPVRPVARAAIAGDPCDIERLFADAIAVLPLGASVDTRGLVRRLGLAMRRAPPDFLAIQAA